MLLVTGPMKVNGVPVKRVNQVYTITTSQKVDLTGVNVPAEVDDSLFKKEKVAKEGNADKFFAENKVLLYFFFRFYLIPSL